MGAMIDDSSLQRNVLIVAVLSSFLTPFMASSVVISLPTMARDLGMNVLTTSWVTTAYLLAAAGFSVPFGRASDIYGRKRIFFIGIVLDIFASILGACAVSSHMLIVARFLQGIGGAMIFTLGVTIISSVFPVEKRGRAIGITIAAVYCGLSLGPVIGGVLTYNLGWRSIFLLNVLIGLVIVTTTIWKLKPEWSGARGESFDLLGSLIYVLSLSCMMYGFSEIPAHFAFVLAAAGAAGLVVFVRWELKTKHPVLEMRLFQHNRTFLFSNMAALVNYSATFAITFLLSLFLQYFKGYSAQGAGAILIWQPIVMALLSPVAGWLADRWDAKTVSSIGMSVTVAGLIGLAFLSPSTSIALIVANLMFLGLGFALFSSPNTSAVMTSVEKRYLGVASGTLATMRVTGQMASMAVVMIIFALFQIGKIIIDPSHYPIFLHTMRTAFVAFAVLCFGGVFASLARGRK
jgi:EmrB/QacA subfamily drug resistance transporter